MAPPRKPIFPPVSGPRLPSTLLEQGVRTARIPPQHPVPGQNPPQNLPFYPGKQSDLLYPEPRPTPPPKTPNSHVATVFDARPIAGQDFDSVQYFISTSGEAANSALVEYVIPDGYVGILRFWGLTTQFADNVPGNQNNWASTERLNMSILLNGNPIVGYNLNNLDVRLARFGWVEDDIYLPVLANSTIGLYLAGGVTQYQGFVSLYGNLLVDIGFDASEAPGTHFPLPVREE